MNDVIYIQASPKGELSTSAKLANIFLESMRSSGRNDSIKKINLFEYDLPEFGYEAATAKFAFASGIDLNEKQVNAWANIQNIINEFDGSKKILIATPMWNGSIPYKLKHYMDIIIQPNLTYASDKNRHTTVGLLRNRPIQFILTRSSVPVGSNLDFQIPYLKAMFAMIGINDQRFIVAENTSQPDESSRSEYINGFSEDLYKAALVF